MVDSDIVTAILIWLGVVPIKYIDTLHEDIYLR